MRRSRPWPRSRRIRSFSARRFAISVDEIFFIILDLLYNSRVFEFIQNAAFSEALATFSTLCFLSLSLINTHIQGSKPGLSNCIFMLATFYIMLEVSLFLNKFRGSHYSFPRLFIVIHYSCF
jgi:hypothetical protein